MGCLEIPEKLSELLPFDDICVKYLKKKAFIVFQNKDVEKKLGGFP